MIFPPRSTLERSSAASDVYKRQGLAERLYGIQKEFKEDLSNALLRREALLRLVDPFCLGDFKWFVFKKFNEKKMNINSTCLR